MKSYLLSFITSDGCRLLISNKISLVCEKRDSNKIIKDSKYGKSNETL